MADKDKPKKKCFVIGPIGGAGTQIRHDADTLFRYIIEPVVTEEKFGYEVSRADHVADPGSITNQVINAVLDSDLVIADLTGQNPNAFYELGIGHLANKPIIHMAQDGTELPFDTKDNRTIFYGLQSPDHHDRAKRDLEKQVQAVEKPGYEPSNPVTIACGVQVISGSADSKDKIIAGLIKQVENLEREFRRWRDIGFSPEMEKFNAMAGLYDDAQPRSKPGRPPSFTATEAKLIKMFSARARRDKFVNSDLVERWLGEIWRIAGKADQGENTEYDVTALLNTWKQSERNLVLEMAVLHSVLIEGLKVRDESGSLTDAERDVIEEFVGHVGDYQF